jgi:hypothetical protein
VILINENTSNTVILTLSEKTTLTNVNYLFEVYNDMTNIYKYFIAQDISTNKLRYNEFIITETITEFPLLGQINLITEGFYKYNVYEQASASNLNPLLALNLIDKGKLKFVKATTNNVVYTGNQTNYIEYGG